MVGEWATAKPSFLPGNQASPGRRAPRMCALKTRDRSLERSARGFPLGQSRPDFACNGGRTNALVDLGGLLVNSGLATMLRKIGVEVGRADNLAIRIEDHTAVARWDSIMERLSSIHAEHIVTPVNPKVSSNSQTAFRVSLQ
jgi:hypothetical protein